jgi:DnaJ-class molecular chaperone
MSASLEDILEHPDIRTMSDDELKVHYRSLCLKYHPDKHKQKDTGDFQRIQTAYNKALCVREVIELTVTLSEIYSGCIKTISTGNDVPEPVYIQPGATDGLIYTENHTIKLITFNDTQFRRGEEGHDLYATISVHVKDVLLGTGISIAHFNSVIDIPTDIPNSDYVHIISGYGMPHGDLYGDMHISYCILFTDYK